MLAPLMTVEEAAKLLRVKPKTIHAFVREGKLACIQLSPRDRRFLPEHIKDFIAARTITPPKKIDMTASSPLPFAPRPKQRGGEGVADEGKSLRARRREEMRSWQ